MNFLLYISLAFIQHIIPDENVDLKINHYLLSGDTLTLKCSINNGTSTIYSVYWGGGWSTLPGISHLTLLIFEDDTLALHIANPFDGYPNTRYKAIEPRGSIDLTIHVDLRQLYRTEHILFKGPSHKITGRCSFQLVYYDQLLDKKKSAKFNAYKSGKRVKRHSPVPDTLRSNILYINTLQQKIEGNFHGKVAKEKI